MDKLSSKQQFYKSDAITFIMCEKTGALAIVEQGLTAGRPGGRQAIRQTKLL